MTKKSSIMGRYQRKPSYSKYKNAFTAAPTLGDLAAGTGGWPAGYGPGTAKKLTKKYKGSKSAIKQGRVMNEGTGGQYSMFSTYRGKCYLPKHVENALPPQVYVTNNASQIKSAVGKQAVGTFLQLFTPGVATTLTADKISNVLFAKATGDVTINNIYLSNAYVIIYDVMCRKDIPQAALSTPDQAWTQGSGDTSATTAPFFLGSTPWQSELFNQFYEVKQVTNVVLCAGGTHVHKVRLQPNRLINSAYANYVTYGFRNLTYFTMIEVHGSPANDSTTQTSVSVGVGGLNAIIDSEHTIKIIAKNTPTITSNNTLATSFAVGEQVVNIGGSTIVAQAEG